MLSRKLVSRPVGRPVVGGAAEGGTAGSLLGVTAAGSTSLIPDGAVAAEHKAVMIGGHRAKCMTR